MKREQKEEGHVCVCSLVQRTEEEVCVRKTELKGEAMYTYKRCLRVNKVNN